MIRNLKALGLALVAMCALGAVVASGASAQQGFLTSSNGKPFTLTGSETGPEKSNALTAFGEQRVECLGSTITGHKVVTTPHTFIPNGATEVTVTPHYGGCKAFPGGFPATVTMNGCDYVFHVGGTDPAGNKEGTFAVTADVICPAGKSITVDIYTSAVKHAENKPFCTLHVKEQKGLTGVHAKNTGSGATADIDVSGTFINIVVTRTNDEDPLLCPASEDKAAKFDIDATIKAHDEALAAVGVSISE